MKRKVTGTMLPYMMKMLVRKPDTIAYPMVPAKVADHFRGALKFDREKCIGCKICMRVCPATAIEIEKIPEEEKKFKAIVSMDKCIFCGQCVDSCPKKALENTEAFELASLNRDSLKKEI
jgi:formate hydrogenlyase subunit 6/NADH:ubiquinone oxidoreductase subunit I